MIIMGSLRVYTTCRIAEDIGESPLNNDSHGPVHENLLSYVGDIKFSTVNLFLTGRASPYLHNTVEYRLNATSLVSPLRFAILECPTEQTKLIAPILRSNPFDC